MRAIAERYLNFFARLHKHTAFKSTRKTTSSRIASQPIDKRDTDPGTSAVLNPLHHFFEKSLYFRGSNARSLPCRVQLSTLAHFARHTHARAYTHTAHRFKTQLTRWLVSARGGPTRIGTPFCRYEKDRRAQLLLLRQL